MRLGHGRALSSCRLGKGGAPPRRSARRRAGRRSRAAARREPERPPMRPAPLRGRAGARKGSRDLRADPAGLRALLDDHHPSGLAGRGFQRREIDRREGPEVDHLGVDPFGGEFVGRLPGEMRHQQPAEDGDVRPLSRHRRLVERNDVIPVGNVARRVDRAGLGARALRAVEQLVLEDHHRIVVADGGLEQPLGVVGVRRRRRP